MVSGYNKKSHKISSWFGSRIEVVQNNMILKNNYITTKSKFEIVVISGMEYWILVGVLFKTKTKIVI